MLGKNFRFVIATLLAFAFFIGGCLGKPGPTPATRFYVLNSFHSQENPNPPEPVTVLEDAGIGVGPIKLSQVLDRPQIILRTSHNEIRVADLDRWAAPLNEIITNVLVDNFSALLSTGSIIKFPWKTTLPVDYQIIVEITRFDGLPGGNVDLRARWGVLSEGGRTVLANRKTVLNEPIDGDTVADMVSGLSRLIGKLSYEISMEIKKIAEQR